MKISTDSWHYRIVRQRTYNPPSDICRYMRLLAIECGQIALLYAGIGFVVTALLTPAVVALTTGPIVGLGDLLPHMLSLFNKPPINLFGALYFLGFLVWCVGIIIGVVAGVMWLLIEVTDKVRDVSYAMRQRPPSERGLFGTWVKSVKEKTCIGLEFVDTRSEYR